MSFALTQHAALRAQQRGVPHAVIAMILDHADVSTPVGSGCSALRLSKERLHDRALRAAFRSGLDRAANVTLLVDDSTSDIVTVLHDRGGREARRYRRAH